MKVTRLVLAFGIAVFLAGYVLAGEKEAASKPQTTCPVMGGKINKEIYADHDGKRVYFCCPMCVNKFKKDPAKYIKKIEGQGVTLDKAIKLQTTCPIKGEKIDRKIYVDHDGKRVYLCCADCVKMFEKDPSKYIKKLEGQGITLDKTPKPQTTCPVMGGKVVKKVYADHDGKRVYFCCPMCINKFKKDPAKYLKKLEEEGVQLENIPKKAGAMKHGQHGGH